MQELNWAINYIKQLQMPYKTLIGNECNQIRLWETKGHKLEIIVIFLFTSLDTRTSMNIWSLYWHSKTSKCLVLHTIYQRTESVLTSLTFNCCKRLKIESFEIKKSELSESLGSFVKDDVIMMSFDFLRFEAHIEMSIDPYWFIDSILRMAFFEAWEVHNWVIKGRYCWFFLFECVYVVWGILRGCLEAMKYISKDTKNNIVLLSQKAHSTREVSHLVGVLQSTNNRVREKYVVEVELSKRRHPSILQTWEKDYVTYLVTIDGLYTATQATRELWNETWLKVLRKL